MKKYISALNLILFTVFITHWCEERDGRTNSNKLKGRSRNYESNSFYQDAEVYALASLSQNCYQNHETYKGIYDEIWNNEQALRDAADARETQGIWKTVGGVFLVVGGTVCIVASGGAATPIVAAGWTAGGGTIAFASSAFIPISQAARVGNLTFRSGVTTVAKEGIAMMAGAGASDVTMRVTGSQTASLVAGMIASGATGRGLNGVDTRFNISGNKWYLKSAYKEFKRLGADKQIEVFKNMNSKEIYNLVKRSPEAWAVEGYDLINEGNAKNFIKITTNSSGKNAFNLDWPKYGGYEPNTISSIGNLKGKIPVSRDGGDGGYTMGFGRNPDGTYPNNSARSIPKSSAEVSTGIFDVDLYKKTVDIVTGNESDFSKVQSLVEMGFSDKGALKMIGDYENWMTRAEIIGENSIADGVVLAGNSVNAKYGYFGKAAEWQIGDVHMSGGAGQMNTIYSWGTLKETGIISELGRAKIN